MSRANARLARLLAIVPLILLGACSAAETPVGLERRPRGSIPSARATMIFGLPGAVPGIRRGRTQHANPRC